MRIIRADERFRTSQPGIESWHVFSAGPHYDPSRLGAGPLIGLDEHVLAPGAGFGEHAHRGVDIVSWVASGSLLHLGEASVVLRSPRVLVQSAGNGTRHEERNASDDEPLRLIQMTLTSALTLPQVREASPPVVADEGRFSVLRSSRTRVEPPVVIHVVDGHAATADDELSRGDTGLSEHRVDLHAAGEVLVWSLGRWN